MALARGTKLGPYQIESPIGAGGMGEVYKATDTRLERTVAIKVLPAHVASDPERRSRFEREAKTVAALSHPHICPVFDVGSEDGTDFLVMEYLEGETLAERLSKGALPLDQALRYAIEIADALDKAHRQGVTHRDLKPANIMLTKAGAKLLDFGLAKLKPTGPQSDASTKLADNLTEQGTILGTFQYMAPEQLEGGEADHRTDIFAYGAVVYEMVTGQRAFSGESRASLIAAILDRAPSPLATLQPLAPAALDHVVRMSLAKTPDDRWQSAGDIAREVKWISESGSQPSAAAVSGEGTNSRLSVGMAVSIALGLSVLTGLAVWGLTRSLQTERRADRFAINVPPGALLNATHGRHIAISPDGGSVVYVAGTIGNTDLYVRAFDELAPTTLTEGQTEIGIPSVSEDGAWVAFNTPRDDSLKKVATLGGPVSAICVGCAQIALGVSWATDDTLVFGSNLPSGLWRVSAEGGDVEELTTPESPQINHAWPEVLPGGRAALFTSLVGEFVETAQIALVDLETGEHEVLIPGGSFPRYSPTGHIVYGDAGTLWAIGFDADRLEVTGARPVPVLDGVLTGRSGINFDFSRNGTLVYVQGPDMTQAIERTPVLVDAQGGEVPVGLPDRRYSGPRFSPDGTRVAVSIDDPENTDVWVSDVARGTLDRLTDHPAPDRAPLWTPSGDGVVFTSPRDGSEALFLMAADGTGSPDRLLLVEDVQRLRAYSWTADGSGLVFEYTTEDGTLTDIGLLSLEGERPWQPLVQTAGSDRAPSVSPDGRWLAYHSDVSGRQEVYVERFPDGGDRRPISTGGGLQPMWSGDGQQLFFWAFLPRRIMGVPVEVGAGFRSGNPEMLFEGPAFENTTGRLIASGSG